MKKLMRLDRAVDEESAKDDNSQEDRAGCSDHLLDYVCICICICFLSTLSLLYLQVKRTTTGRQPMITHWKIKQCDDGKVLHDEDVDDGDIDLEDKEDGAKDNIKGCDAGRVVNALLATFNFNSHYPLTKFYPAGARSPMNTNSSAGENGFSAKNGSQPDRL